MNISISNILIRTQQFIRYTLVGIVATITHYIILYLLVDGLQLLTPVFASFVAFICGASIGFFCNSKLVFLQGKSGIYELSKYIILATLNCISNTALMYLFVNELKLFYLYAQIVCTGLIFVSNYFVCKYWIFKPREYAA